MEYLAELIKGDSGELCFEEQPIVIACGLSFWRANWRFRTITGVKHLALSLSASKKAFSGDGSVVTVHIPYDEQEPLLSRQRVVQALIEHVRALKLCKGCLVRGDLKPLAADECFACHLRRELNPTTIDCSICQEPATGVYYSTDCGHHFHYACIAKEFDRVYKQHRRYQHHDTELKCPNCRCKLEDEYQQVMLDIVVEHDD